MTAPSENVKYTKVAIILHWLIALAIIAMLASGLVMGSDLIEKSLSFQMYQWHKSLGVILIWLVGLRLFWRLTHKPPALPESLSENEKFWAHTGHWILYLWMIVMPISGWVLVSSSAWSDVPTIIFGGPEWPHIPGIAKNKEIHEIAEEIHEFFGYSFIALIVGHIAAVIVHKVKHKTSLLPRMSLCGNCRASAKESAEKSE